MNQHFQQEQVDEWGGAKMPCPEPSLAAVEAGIFGCDESGAICPTSDAVRALTEEHARELYGILQDLFHLRYCASHGIDPVSGRAPRGSDRQHSLMQRLERESQSLASHYDEALAAYADGFGWEAADALDSFVRALLAGVPPEPSPLRQRELF